MRNRRTAISTGALIVLVFLAYHAATAQTFSAAGETDRPAGSADPVPAMLDTGFRNLYELNFNEARAQFLAYQKARPQDPLGVVAEAASHLFEQFNEKGIFTSDFFLNDEKFLKGATGTPEENKNEPFLVANGRAREMAKEMLKYNPSDQRALLVITMADGMESDYDALIIKKQLAGLSLMKQAEADATKLLAVDPNEKDAYLALGASNYVIGCLPGFKRAFLWFGGVHGDRERGIELMQQVADHGHYLQPFAKIMLALAYEREHQPDHARVLLSDLASQFPSNPLFARELALVNHPAAPCSTNGGSARC